jgi:menaquinone-dependent protoporphyrinogen oxidase
MRILIVYGSTEGHTRDLCRVLSQALTAAGDDVTVCDAESGMAGVVVSSFDVIFLAASLHVGQYQPALVQFARSNHEFLNGAATAFISVSLSAAGENPDDWEGLEQCLARFLHETRWMPKSVYQAEGAIRYSQYDFFKRLAIKYIASKHGMPTVTSQDYDLTDYDALTKFVLSFADEERPKHVTG